MARSTLAVLVALCAGVSAFAPAPTGSVRTSALSAEMSKSVPFLLKPTYPSGMAGDFEFDPLGLAENFDIKWLREAELKNGRAAMLACLGYVVQEFYQLPGEQYSNPNPLEAFSQVGPEPILQLIFGLGFIEYGMNKGKMTTMNMFEDGREPGDFGFDPIGLMKPGDPNEYALKEITHCRLAMLAIGGMVQQSLLTGTGLFGGHA
eukprot:CAMPEP_0172582260 /NCGR_PEP_ID=MMETSP1068-20121228/1711_1 /TAXON_ID=35684 /ORGANISM="Pseudopedinella elastica, Strain CCMP716" /LENGTH=204 /DNA_ID=CAMNT_0013375563 /DNA_START=41 /DNA_END=655 /DNA_ORIENTATION=+